MRTVEYTPKPVTFAVTNAEFDLVWALYNQGEPASRRKVAAIKFIREQYSIGLYEAKRICDAIGAIPDNDTSVKQVAEYQEPTTLGQLLRAKLEVR